MTEEEKIICKQFLNDADKTHSCNEYKLLMQLLEQEPQTSKWCTDCKEYDQEKHCCHRWSKVIRNTVEEMNQEQESIIEKIRAEIKAMSGDIETIADVLVIIDKYKGESEG